MKYTLTKLRKLLILAVIMTIFSCSPGNHAISKNDKLYLDFIFYRSLYYAYNQDTIFLNDASEGVYMDLSGFTITGKLRTFLEAEAKKRASDVVPIEISDYNGRKSVFKDLLDKYNDEKLSYNIIKEINIIRKSN